MSDDAKTREACVYDFVVKMQKSIGDRTLTDSMGSIGKQSCETCEHNDYYNEHNDWTQCHCYANFMEE